LATDPTSVKLPASVDAMATTSHACRGSEGVQRPARLARRGVPNPFRPGETMDVAARSASRKVKVVPFMRLKAMVGRPSAVI
jgi:hypothetical protein